MPKKTTRRDTPDANPAATEEPVTSSPSDAKSSAAPPETDAVAEAAAAEPEETKMEAAEDDMQTSETDTACSGGTLLDEVQAFFGQREELAQRLADEIEATQEKLAELQETLAQLYPDRAASSAKDRKPKKARKPAVRNTGEAAAAKPSE